jgi:acyl carrier protein
VLAPKALGAWNLHVATRGAALDFMVGYGSAVGLLGAPGQGAYAAANCYLSALAQLRHARGLPGLVVEWGPFGEVGMGARARLGARGLELLSPAQSPQLIAAMLRAGSVRAGVVPFDVRQWIEFFPQLAASTRLAELLAHAAAPRADEAPLRRELAATTVPRQPELVVSFVRKQVSELLRIDAERVGRDLPLLGLGVDSLVGLELRNRLARACGLSLPTTLVWTYATVAALAEYLLSRLRDEAPPAQLERAHDDAYASVEGDALLTRFDAELAALEEQV